MLVHPLFFSSRRWYREDTMRLHPELDTIDNVLLDRFVRLASDLIRRKFSLSPLSARSSLSPLKADSLDSVTLEPTHNQEQIDTWQTLTETPFDPLEALASAQGRYVRCPLSSEVLFTRKITFISSALRLDERLAESFPPAWVTPEGTGYAQQSFSIPSRLDPTFHITHEVLGISKLARDLQILGSTSPPVHHLSGTLFAANEDKYGAKAADLRGERLKKLLITWKSPFFTSDGVILGEAMEWSLEGARKAMVKQFRGRNGPG